MILGKLPSLSDAVSLAVHGNYGADEMVITYIKCRAQHTGRPNTYFLPLVRCSNSHSVNVCLFVVFVSLSWANPVS